MLCLLFMAASTKPPKLWPRVARSGNSASGSEKSNNRRRRGPTRWKNRSGHHSCSQEKENHLCLMVNEAPELMP